MARGVLSEDVCQRAQITFAAEARLQYMDVADIVVACFKIFILTPGPRVVTLETFFPHGAPPTMRRWQWSGDKHHAQLSNFGDSYAAPVGRGSIRWAASARTALT